MRLTRRAACAAILASAAAAAPARAGEPPVFANLWGHAIRGYDPVAYFREGRPVEGDAAHELEWNGAAWRFSSAENLAAFEADPEAYAPQYGGYCAYAVAKGSTASVDPEQWSVVDGKLYLNYSADIHERWKADVPGHIRAADANWPGVLD